MSATDPVIKLKDLVLLLVDNDEMISRSMELSIGKYCKKFVTASSAEEANAVCEQLMPDVVLTDIALPKENGVWLASKLKHSCPQVPVIGMTSLGSHEIMQQCLVADMYAFLKKPCDIDEIVMTVLMAHKKRNVVQTVQLTKGYLLDYQRGLIGKNGELVELTKKELSIVKILASNIGTPLDYSAIEGGAWGQGGMTLQTLRMHINNIRKKTHRGFIQNFSGVGYVIK